MADLTVEDLRILIGQQIGVRWLLRPAVDILARDPLAEGDYYPGDLLSTVLRLPPSAWHGLHDERERLAGTLDDLLARSGSDDRVRGLRDDISSFRAG